MPVSENRMPNPSAEPFSSMASPRAAAAWRADVAVGRGRMMDATSSSVICFGADGRQLGGGFGGGTAAQLCSQAEADSQHARPGSV